MSNADDQEATWRRSVPLWQYANSRLVTHVNPPFNWNRQSVCDGIALSIRPRIGIFYRNNSLSR
jgi:hypothetical protein